MVEEEVRLPVNQIGEEHMAAVTCVSCGHQRRVRVEYKGTGSSTDDVLRGVLTCKRKEARKQLCNGITVFELANDGMTFYPGRLFEEDLQKGVAPDAREMMGEAVRCFYGASNRGTVAFCRSAAEEALAAKEVPGRDLDAKIKKAGDYLSDDEKTFAHSARLVGRNAIHHMAVVSTAAALGSLNNTIEFLNVVQRKEPFPEWQSKQGSNEE